MFARYAEYNKLQTVYSTESFSTVFARYAEYNKLQTQVN